MGFGDGVEDWTAPAEEPRVRLDPSIKDSGEKWRVLKEAVRVKGQAFVKKISRDRYKILKQ
jgi:hypothetical protein